MGGGRGARLSFRGKTRNARHPNKIYPIMSVFVNKIYLIDLFTNNMLYLIV